MTLWNRIARNIVNYSHALAQSGRRFAHHGPPAFYLEELEPRLLFSGDVAAAVIGPTPEQTVTVTDLLAKGASSFTTMAQQPTSSVANAGTQVTDHSTQSSSRTYFLSPAGNDANDGSSPALALKTLTAVS